MVSGPAAETARGQERNQGGLPGGRAVGGDAAVHRSATPAPREVGISSPPSARAPGPLEDPGGPGTLTAGRAFAVGDHQLEALPCGPRLREGQAQRARGHEGKRAGAPGRAPQTAPPARVRGPPQPRTRAPGSADAPPPCGSAQRSRCRCRCGISKSRRLAAEATSRPAPGAGQRSRAQVLRSPWCPRSAERGAHTARKPRPRRPRPGAEPRPGAPEPGVYGPRTALSCGAAPRNQGSRAPC